MKRDRHGIDRSQVDVPPVLNDDLISAGRQACLGGTLRHRAGDGRHGTDPDPISSAGHPLGNGRRIGLQSDRRQRRAELAVPFDVLLQDAPLSNDLSRNGVKRIATDAEHRFAMSEVSICALSIHYRNRSEPAESGQNAEEQAPKGQTRMQARHSMQSASLYTTSRVAPSPMLSAPVGQ